MLKQLYLNAEFEKKAAVFQGYTVRHTLVEITPSVKSTQPAVMKELIAVSMMTASKFK